MHGPVVHEQAVCLLFLFLVLDWADALARVLAALPPRAVSRFYADLTPDERAHWCAAPAAPARPR